MNDEKAQDETPWEVNEYRYEPPAFLELLFSPAGGAPLALLILIGLWRCTAG